jgi:hypothetical protein
MRAFAGERQRLIAYSARVELPSPTLVVVALCVAPLLCTVSLQISLNVIRCDHGHKSRDPVTGPSVTGGIRPVR